MNALTSYPMNEQQLMSTAPSVFATGAHESRSSRYGYIPTIEVVRAMAARGFLLMSAKQGRSKIEGKASFTKHLLRFRHESAAARTDRKVGDTYPEIVLLNSHDGTSAYQLHGGLFRLACLNGMVVADATVGVLRVGHTLRAVEGVIDASFQIIEHTQVAVQRAAEWSQIMLTHDEQMEFANAARTIRFGDAEGVVTTGVEPRQLLNARRTADVGGDLWKTFNVVQENALRGGLADHREARFDEATRRRIPARTLRTRSVNGIDGDVKLNKALWQLAEGMAKLKAA
jgi:hypothetical protein